MILIISVATGSVIDLDIKTGNFNYVLSLAHSLSQNSVYFKKLLHVERPEGEIIPSNNLSKLQMAACTQSNFLYIPKGNSIMAIDLLNKFSF